MDGIQILKEKLISVPETPGVYRMLNANGDVLYVGKAKNLKNRLNNYVQDGRLSHRIRKMVFETRDLLIVETASEQEALLLEISFIKSLKPKYNILFRDDTSYPYIHITSQEAPRLTHHRGKKRGKGQYFGPFPDVKAMYQTMEEMEKVFLLRTCKDTDFATRTRPCLKYQIKRCSAPCVGKISVSDYAKSVDDAVRFLRGQGEEVQGRLQGLMLQASEDMRFEDAANYRDRLQALSTVLRKQTSVLEGIGTADFVALARSGTRCCIQIFSYLEGRHVGHVNMFPKCAEDDENADILRLVVTSYYLERSAPVPKIIYLSEAMAEHEIVSEILENSGNTSENVEKIPQKQPHVKVLTPTRGKFKDVLLRVQKNAEDALKRKQAQGASWRQQLNYFSELLEIGRDVTRIETFDISNISGKHAVASMVVADEEGMLKRDYRKFAIKGKDTPDDYAMMREVLTRRYGRLLKETQKARAGEAGAPDNVLDDVPDDMPAWPDVIMVDGGKGHLRVLTEVMEALGIDGPEAPILCAIAKGEFRDKGLETIFQQGREMPLDIPFNSPLKFMLQIIRDESHRFAIGYHRAKRSKETIKSVLDDIPNVGPKRKKALLLTFGSAKGVKDASVKELSLVDGVSEELAQFIYDYLR